MKSFLVILALPVLVATAFADEPVFSCKTPMDLHTTFSVSHASDGIQILVSDSTTLLNLESGLKLPQVYPSGESVASAELSFDSPSCEFSPKSPLLFLCSSDASNSTYMARFLSPSGNELARVSGIGYVSGSFEAIDYLANHDEHYHFTIWLSAGAGKSATTSQFYEKPYCR